MPSVTVIRKHRERHVIWNSRASATLAGLPSVTPSSRPGWQLRGAVVACSPTGSAARSPQGPPPAPVRPDPPSSPYVGTFAQVRDGRGNLTAVSAATAPATARGLDFPPWAPSLSGELLCGPPTVTGFSSHLETCFPSTGSKSCDLSLQSDK